MVRTAHIQRGRTTLGYLSLTGSEASDESPSSSQPDMLKHISGTSYDTVRSTIMKVYTITPAPLSVNDTPSPDE